MKKKIIVGLLFLIVLTIFLVYYININKNEDVFVDYTKTNKSNNKMLSMMIETGYKSGEYQSKVDSSYPVKGYIFNGELSGCENGGKISWDDVNKTVTITSNISDKCYVYFDKDILVEITDYKITTSETEIKIDVTATTDFGSIVKYYFSKDNGVSYVASTSNSYTFSGLSAGNYNVLIYAEDSNGKKSDISSEEVIILSRPINPNISFDSNYNVVLSGSTSENGSVSYYYSFDNKTFTKGSSISVSSTSIVYAYAMDEKNQKSDVVSKTVTIGNSVNETVSSTYYCSRTGTYQSSSTCNFSYNASSTTTYSCKKGNYSGGHCVYLIDDRSYDNLDQCNMWCEFFARDGNGEYSCTLDNLLNNPYSCRIYLDAVTENTYVCNNGGTLSDTTCSGSESASLRYKCSANNKYYTSNSSATTACTNYCATGTYYNNKCYSLS